MRAGRDKFVLSRTMVCVVELFVVEKVNKKFRA